MVRRRRAVTPVVLALALCAGPLAAGCSNDHPATAGTPTAALTGVESPSVSTSAAPEVTPSAPSPSAPSTPSPSNTSPSTPASLPATPSGAATATGSVTAPPTRPASPPTTAAPTAPGIVPPDGTGATLVAAYGTAGTPALGILGRGTPQQAWTAVAARAKAYDRPGLPAKPVFELIVTIAAASPGEGGKYRSRIDDDAISPYVEVARASGGTIFLDIQPGRSDFLTEAKALQKWLVLPNVGLALDPEWRMGPGKVPGQSIGSVDADEINDVSAWLDELVVDRHLPDKLFVVHQFTSSMIRGERRLASRPHLREVINVDGFGLRSAKLSKYRAFVAESPWPMGLKLFTKKRNDPDLLQPAEVLAIKPRPVLVNYQ